MNLPNDKNQVLTGMKHIIKAFWRYSRQMWFLQNSQLHNTINDPFNFKKLQLIEDIAALYEKVDKMLHADQELFKIPLETRIKHHSIMQLQVFFRNSTNTTMQHCGCQNIWKQTQENDTIL